MKNYKKIAILLLMLFVGTTMQAEKYTNELIHQDSPYLRQHAHNPVDWMAWEDRAFERAKKENKLIFLSIGYSTCHWCHVMERETFENEESAKILNDDYVSIKVDREEMPDIDKYYQDVFYLLNKRGGGWPLTIVMTPNKEVIFAATYLPAVDTPNISSFNHVVSFIADKFKKSPQEINKSAKSIQAALEHYNRADAKKGDIDKKVLEQFVTDVKGSFDELNKGIGQAPKFPHASTFHALLDIYKVTKNQDALFMAEDALKAMAMGGINDQIEGGFYRYSTDEAWAIPHFEKMLYTNAELISTYSNLYSIKPTLFTKKVIENTIENMNERFLQNGLYKSASDADSEGDEGKYFVFKYSSSKMALESAGFNKTEVDEILKYFNITKYGNFEGSTTNPYVDEESIPKDIQKAKKVLKELRGRTNYPFVDDKILTSWNALMASSLFDAGVVDGKYSKDGVKLVDNILKHLQKDGILYHQLLFGSTLKVKGLLEDYSFLIDALLKANQYTQNPKYIKVAKTLTNEAIEKFYKNKTWYLSDGDFKSKAPLDDSSYKSASAKMIQNVFTLSLLDGDTDLYFKAQDMVAYIASKVKNYPSAYPEAVKTVIMDKVGEIALKGSKNDVEKLEKIKNNVNYPFIYIIETKEAMLQACSNTECFSYSNDEKKIEEDIRKYIKY